MSATYKDTLLLPKTDFPMKAGLASLEARLLKRWEEDNLYDRIQAARTDAPLYVLHDGPPFANGDIHMGTALNKVLKDFVIKSRTMLGFRAPFLPGWDCHGLPIEFKVVKESKGLSPAEVRRKSEAYARKFIDVQRTQFRRLGVFGDWERPYLTLDPAYEAEIIRCFGKFVEKGLVYQSKKPVLWSTGAQTALAEAEVEYQEKESPAVFVRFPIVSGPWAGRGDIVIWTTTPWTLPANLAIAVHPEHAYVLAKVHREGNAFAICVAEALLEKVCMAAGLELGTIEARATGKELAASRAQHPFLDRKSSVLAADFVTLDTGSGCVHIAPGHGEDDYHLGRQHGLELLSPVDDAGAFTEECGLPQLVGKYVFAANEEIIQLLAEKGALLARERYQHSYPHCWRSKTPVIFRAVEQFFIRIDAIRGEALAGINEVQWIPHWGRNRIAGTVEARPDWCISRQRSWGVPLPIFYDAEKQPILDPDVIARVADWIAEKGTNIWFEASDKEAAARCGAPPGSTRRVDTLDVWIDSGVSHQAVLRRQPELSFPADLYLEATDQHRGWFQSSLMTSVAINGCPPYRSVLTHGFVVDLDGKKISKSSDYQKPMDAAHFMDKYGAELVRLWVSSVDFTDDVPFSEEIFTRLSDVYRRIRNTLRILLGNLHDFTDEAAEVAEPTLIDRWILARLDQVVRQCREAYEALDFHRAHQVLVQFCANDLSALYVDVTKDRLYCDAAKSPRRRATQAAMLRIADSLCRLLAPILAFTAEEAWGFLGREASVHLQEFPKAPDADGHQEALRDMERLLELRSLVAQEMDATKKRGEIGNSLEASVELQIADEDLLALAKRYEAELEELFILSELHTSRGAETIVRITPTDRRRCSRCWRHRADVGSNAAHPELCGRCLEAIA